MQNKGPQGVPLANVRSVSRQRSHDVMTISEPREPQSIPNSLGTPHMLNRPRSLPAAKPTCIFVCPRLDIGATPRRRRHGTSMAPKQGAAASREYSGPASPTYNSPHSSRAASTASRHYHTRFYSWQRDEAPPKRTYHAASLLISMHSQVAGRADAWAAVRGAGAPYAHPRARINPATLRWSPPAHAHSARTRGRRLPTRGC